MARAPVPKRLRKIYEKMRDRCNNPTSHNYHRYGAKGIAICKEWLGESRAFYCWALANGYDDDLQIDRIDNAGGYSPDNCRWITHKQNQSNRGNNQYLTYQGLTLTYAQWAERTGIYRGTIRKRHILGWPMETIFSTPVAPPSTAPLQRTMIY